MRKKDDFQKDLSIRYQKLIPLPCKISVQVAGRCRVNALERRSEIIERMKVRKFDTAFNLAHEFGVSRLTILRDVQELSVSGYPIIAEQGRGGGIRWVGGKRSFPFTEREVVALHNAIATVSPEDKPVLENLIRERTKAMVDKNDVFKMLTGRKSQRALAAELGISESHLSRVLSGHKKPSEALVDKISKARRAESES